ncbi:nucleotidyltransferase family protein [Litorilinea aerophila]|uniref:Nucleotidyltransferase family protein n=1 Tax=Litorilinea aerophila TaxID=1204385 RepID=A0A540VFI1_9CHLR|nr:nucleotidyltransferase family protein [Litorilinea aerophila]MCC9076803.1 nucleotidyltransferase family protein [Litorilinea aerophila]GIV76534.1 MAG: hypothetical protein KatS3mg050_0928 [Litorilinea sp.]
MTKALILAAGKGTRLGPLTARQPKPMLPVGGRPLLAHTVAWLRHHGIREIAMNLHHCPEAITGYFGQGEGHGVHLTYSYEDTLWGTAGAARRLASFLDTTFVVVYGDVFTNLDLTRLLDGHRGRAELTLALYRVPNPGECGLVETDPQGRVTRFVEKPPPDQIFTDLANGGILVCEPSILDWIPAETVYDFGHDLLPALLAAGRPVYGQPIRPDEVLIDIGTPAGYRRAQEAFPAVQDALTREGAALLP